MGANRYTVIHHTTFIVCNICDLLERPSFRCFLWHIYLNERYGDKHEFEEHCYWTQCASNTVMCWVLCWAWTAEEPDVVGLCNTLVCCSNCEPYLHPTELLEELMHTLNYEGYSQ